MTVLLTLLIDHWLGEPPVRWHPVVWMGHYLGWAGRRVAPAADEVRPARDTRAFVWGALAWSLGALLVGLTAWGLEQALAVLPWPWLSLILTALLLKPLLAWAMLRSEVQAVEAALAQSLPAGRERLSWLVSRDVTRLTEAEVRESAIETLAENLNDSVVAPIVWFLLLGLPGAALYRYANTADAMWGYREVRGGRQWLWAGKWAARVDDVLSWLPARLTVLLLGLGAWGWTAWRGDERPARLQRPHPGPLPERESPALAAAQEGESLAPRARGERTGLHWSALLRLPEQARRTTSPNGGWPMAAVALLLGVRLGKPGVYVLNPQGRVPLAADTDRALRCAAAAVVVLALAALFLPWGWLP